MCVIFIAIGMHTKSLWAASSNFQLHIFKVTAHKELTRVKVCRSVICDYFFRETKLCMQICDPVCKNISYLHIQLYTFTSLLNMLTN